MKISKKDALMWFRFFAELPDDEELMPHQQEIALAALAQIETAVNKRREALAAKIDGLQSLSGRTYFVGSKADFPRGCCSCLLGTGLSAVRAVHGQRGKTGARRRKRNHPRPDGKPEGGGVSGDSVRRRKPCSSKHSRPPLQSAGSDGHSRRKAGQTAAADIFLVPAYFRCRRVLMSQSHHLHVKTEEGEL